MFEMIEIVDNHDRTDLKTFTEHHLAYRIVKSASCMIDCKSTDEMHDLTTLLFRYFSFCIRVLIASFYFTGSCRMDKNCTCTMKVIEDQAKRVTVEFCMSHYGHRRSLQYLWLSKKKRQEIAAKLKQGVSKEKVLDAIRENIGAIFSRDHLIDKQDLANIRRAYGIDEVERHPNDMTSVLSWIQEWQNSDKNPILHFKLQGILKIDHTAL